jgi:hypothetical protein
MHSNIQELKIPYEHNRMSNIVLASSQPDPKHSLVIFCNQLVADN